MAKRSRSSKAKQTGRATSQKLSQQQQGKQKKPGTTTALQQALSRMSDEQFQMASLTAQKLAMLDALSMLQKKSLRYEQMQRKLS